MLKQSPIRLAKKHEQTPRNGNLGIVQKVFTRDDQRKRDTNHEVNVLLQNSKEELRRVPVHVQRIGEARVPKVGDFVHISYLAGKSQQPCVTGFAYDTTNRAPLGDEGHWRERFGDTPGPYLFLESEPRNHGPVGQGGNTTNTLRMAVKEDGMDDPTARIEIDTSGNEPVVRITRGKEEEDETDMGIELDFDTGEFKLSDGDGLGLKSDGEKNIRLTEHIYDEDTDGTMGAEVDFDTGEFKVSDGDGLGLQSDGNQRVQLTNNIFDSTTGTMGAEFDFNTGGFKIGDQSGYGIESDGNGNFTWYEQSVDFVDDGSTLDW